MSNSIPIPYQGDELDLIVAEAESKLKSKNGVGVIIGLKIGDAVSHTVEDTSDCSAGMKAFSKATNAFMNKVNQRHLPMDVIVRTVGWQPLDDALLHVLVNASLDFMAK